MYYRDECLPINLANTSDAAALCAAPGPGLTVLEFAPWHALTAGISLVRQFRGACCYMNASFGQAARAALPTVASDTAWQSSTAGVASDVHCNVHA